MRSGNPNHAAFQTYTVVSVAAATKLPDGMSFVQGATLPTTVGTAAITMVDVLGLHLPGTKSSSESSEEKKKKWILIWGGASSVGSAAIQLARLAGLSVFTAASPKHHERLRALGASAVVDYRSPTAVEDLVAAAKQQAGVDITLAVNAVGTRETARLVVEVLGRFDAGVRK
jgi:NADPH:quinone reductase-like Zn-dependent oxidoreductase